MIKSLKSLVVIVFSFLVIAQTSCSSDDDSNNANAECKDTICTLVMIRLTVAITDKDQKPVALDSFKVVQKENGKDITLSLSSSEFTKTQELGQYPLIEDGVLDVNQKQNLLFKGYINNQEVISSEYTVSTDCCHVGLVSGKLELTL